MAGPGGHPISLSAVSMDEGFAIKKVQMKQAIAFTKEEGTKLHKKIDFYKKHFDQVGTFTASSVMDSPQWIPLSGFTRA